MALIKDISLILAKMRNDKLQFYRVMDSDGKTKIDENDDPNTGLDAAIDSLENTLNACDGLVHVIISAKSTKDKAAGGDTRQFKYAIKLGTGTVSGIGAVGPAGNQWQMMMDLMNQNFKLQTDAMLQKFEDQKRYEDLQRKLGEIGEGNPYIEFAMKKLDRMFPDGAPAAQPTVTRQPAIHGVPAEEKKPEPLKKIEMTEEQTKQLNYAIHCLLEADPNLIEHLTMLAKMAKEDPDIYELAIKKLKKLNS